LRIGVVDAAAEALDGGLHAALRPGDVLALNKSDLVHGAAATAAAGLAQAEGWALVRTAAGTGAGTGELLDALSQRTAKALGAAEAPPLTRARHRALLTEACEHLERALGALDAGAELAGEDARLAARALGRITGRIDVEDVLDAIFSQFCIGK
jgi:tRNA modification GTPase